MEETGLDAAGPFTGPSGAVVAAIDDGMSCLASAARFGVSAASAIRWRQLVLQHGTSAAKRQGGDRRAGRVDAHATFILDAIEAKDDITLVGLQTLWPSEARLSVSLRCGSSSTGTGSRAKKRQRMPPNRVAPMS